MAAVLFGAQFHFGIGFDPTRLPEGWHLVEGKTEFARAVDPDGNQYLLHKNGAYPTTLSHGCRSVNMDADPTPYRTPSQP